MRIVKPGREQKGWSIETACTGNGNGGGGCGALLLVEEADLFLTFRNTFRNARDETTTYVTFRCVSCNVPTDIQSVPLRVQEAVRQRIEAEKAETARRRQAESEREDREGK